MSQDFLLCGQLQDEICHDVVTTWPFVLMLTLPFCLLVSSTTSSSVSPLRIAWFHMASLHCSWPKYLQLLNILHVSLELNVSVVLYIVSPGAQATIQNLLKIDCLLSKLACCTFFITHRWPESVHVWKPASLPSVALQNTTTLHLVWHPPL